MAPTVFAVGLTGYIGGDAIAHLVAKHSEYHIRALVRSLKHASEFKSQFPSLDLVEGERLGIKTAIVSPPQVHEKGRGVKKYGYSLYQDAVVKHGKAFVVNKGENIWGQIHISDLSSAISVLVDSALSSSSVSGKTAAGWGEDGYYFLEAEELPFSVQADTVARLFQKAGLLERSEIDHLGPEAVGKFHQYAVIMWGSSSRPRAQKLRALGWEPVGPKRDRTLEADIKEYIAARQ
jgi:hypothetical protein